MRGHRRGLCVRLRRMTRLGIHRPARHPTMPLASENSRYKGAPRTDCFPPSPPSGRHAKTATRLSPEIRRPPSGRRPTAHAQRGDRPVCGVSHRARRGLPRSAEGIADPPATCPPRFRQEADGGCRLRQKVLGVKTGVWAVGLWVLAKADGGSAHDWGVGSGRVQRGTSGLPGRHPPTALDTPHEDG